MYKDKKYIIIYSFYKILTLHLYPPLSLLCRFMCAIMFPLRLNVAPQIEHVCLLEPCDNLCCRN